MHGYTDPYDGGASPTRCWGSTTKGQSRSRRPAVKPALHEGVRRDMRSSPRPSRAPLVIWSRRLKSSPFSHRLVVMTLQKLFGFAVANHNECPGCVFCPFGGVPIPRCASTSSGIGSSLSLRMSACSTWSRTSLLAVEPYQSLLLSA